jgi:hypothetical protein
VSSTGFQSSTSKGGLHFYLLSLGLGTAPSPSSQDGRGARAIRFPLLFCVAVLVFDGGTGSVTLQSMPWDIRSEAAKERIVAFGIVLVLVFVAVLCSRL